MPSLYRPSTDGLILLKHYDPQPLVIGERFRFYQRSQKSGESIADFVADLRRLSIKCEFGDFLDQALRDRFVCVRNEALPRKLLTESDLTIKRAQELAQSMESADLNAKGDGTTSRAPEFVDQAISFSVSEKFGPCHRCGRRHDARTCKFKGATCHRCGKQGHIAPVCKSASPPPADRGKKKFNYRASHRRQTGGTKLLDTEVEDNDSALP